VRKKCRSPKAAGNGAPSAAGAAARWGLAGREGMALGRPAGRAGRLGIALRAAGAAPALLSGFGPSFNSANAEYGSLAWIGLRCRKGWVGLGYDPI
jgi:hypothetical protein